MIASLVFVPVLVSYRRNDRTLGPVGYWLSVVVLDAQALAVLAIPIGGLDGADEWIVWTAVALIAVGVGVGAWFAETIPTSGPLLRRQRCDRQQGVPYHSTD